MRQTQSPEFTHRGCDHRCDHIWEQGCHGGRKSSEVLSVVSSRGRGAEHAGAQRAARGDTAGRGRLPPRDRGHQTRPRAPGPWAPAPEL